MDVDASIAFLHLDDDLLSNDHPLLTEKMLHSRYSDTNEKEIGRVIRRMLKHHNGKRAERFLMLINQHFVELQKAYELGMKCNDHQAKESANTVKYALIALRKVHMLCKYVPELK